MSVTCDRCKHAEDSNTDGGGYFCTLYKFTCSGIFGCEMGYPRAKTNADRIRSMTDEELAEFFTTTEVKCYKRLEYQSDVERFKVQWLEWLKEEVKE